MESVHLFALRLSTFFVRFDIAACLSVQRKSLTVIHKHVMVLQRILASLSVNVGIVQTTARDILLIDPLVTKP
jgi:hypothetical protein